MTYFFLMLEMNNLISKKTEVRNYCILFCFQECTLLNSFFLILKKLSISVLISLISNLSYNCQKETFFCFIFKFFKKIVKFSKNYSTFMKTPSFILSIFFLCNFENLLFHFLLNLLLKVI